MNTNRPNAATPSTPARASTTSGAISAESQQAQQRLWVKEQEVSALKVQNRHLIGKLEDAVKSAEPNQINTKQIADEIQKQIRPLMAEIGKTLTDSFDILKSTMRGIYQQSQRAQQAVEDMTAHSRETEKRAHDTRKSDQEYYQEKILSQVTSFGDRIERQLENRLRSLAVVELMNTKQNEVLADIDQIKSTLAAQIESNEALMNEIKVLRKESATKISLSPNIESIAEIFSESSHLKAEAIYETEAAESFLKGTVGPKVVPVPFDEKTAPRRRFTLDHL